MTDLSVIDMTTSPSASQAAAHLQKISKGSLMPAAPFLCLAECRFASKGEMRSSVKSMVIPCHQM
jgi:hypothetical protein